MEDQSVNKNPKVLFEKGAKKGVYTGHSETVIKTKGKEYDSTLQQVNNRICSYRPNVSKVDVTLGLWDGKTWDIGEYAELLAKNPKETLSGLLFKDFKLLVKSSACMRGYQHPSKVRGGTYEDVDDFFNFVVLKLCERRLKQFDPNSSCRELDNWPSYIARTIPQFLILYNKSKFDFEVEAFWPLVKDEKSGKWVQKDFGISPELPTRMFSEKALISVIDKAIAEIPESKGREIEIYMYLLYNKSFSDKRFISTMVDIVKLQVLDKYRGELL